MPDDPLTTQPSIEFNLPQRDRLNPDRLLDILGDEHNLNSEEMSELYHQAGGFLKQGQASQENQKKLIQIQHKLIIAEIKRQQNSKTRQLAHYLREDDSINLADILKGCVDREDVSFKPTSLMSSIDEPLVYGNTLLHLAIKQHDWAVAIKLVSRRYPPYGASLSAKDQNGLRPIDLIEFTQGPVNLIHKMFERLASDISDYLFLSNPVPRLKALKPSLLQFDASNPLWRFNQMAKEGLNQLNRIHAKIKKFFDVITNPYLNISLGVSAWGLVIAGVITGALFGNFTPLVIGLGIGIAHFLLLFGFSKFMRHQLEYKAGFYIKQLNSALNQAHLQCLNTAQINHAIGRYYHPLKGSGPGDWVKCAAYYYRAHRIYEGELMGLYLKMNERPLETIERLAVECYHNLNMDIKTRARELRSLIQNNADDLPKVLDRLEDEPGLDAASKAKLYYGLMNQLDHSAPQSLKAKLLEPIVEYASNGQNQIFIERLYKAHIAYHGNGRVPFHTFVQGLLEQFDPSTLPPQMIGKLGLYYHDQFYHQKAKGNDNPYYRRRAFECFEQAFYREPDSLNRYQRVAFNMCLDPELKLGELTPSNVTLRRKLRDYYKAQAYNQVLTQIIQSESSLDGTHMYRFFNDEAKQTMPQVCQSEHPVQQNQLVI